MLVLSVYVDGFKLAGPKDNLSEGWKLIREHIQMEDPTPLQLYLGCIHRKFDKYINGVGPVTGIEYDMESFLASCVQHYLRMCAQGSTRQGAGKRNTKKCKGTSDDGQQLDPAKFLSVVPTLFLNESDQRESPQGAPVADDSCATTCPSCRFQFVPGNGSIKEIEEPHPNNSSYVQYHNEGGNDEAGGMRFPQ